MLAKATGSVNTPPFSQSQDSHPYNRWGQTNLKPDWPIHRLNGQNQDVVPSPLFIYGG